MIDLKKQDNVADAVNEILQQEALKGNQGAIDANHNGEVDSQDFKILRAKKKKVEEELKGNQGEIDANNNGKVDREDFKILRGKKKVKEEIDMNDRTKDTLVGREKTKQKDDVGPNSNAKVSKFKLKSEEAEQIDEKNVPTSPEKWAQAKSAAKSKFAVYPSAYANGWASKKYKSMGGGWKATSEEVEQIDELSKETLGSYLDKKKSEYMKGKTQSGSKENAKDIQNMGKAHDKMTLKKMKESFEEPILDELINEVMSKDASAGDWIHDFVHSDNPKFAGKSKAKRKEMALAAYYSKKNEEVVNEGLKDMAKKTFKALTGGSDKDHLDRLKKDMYGDSEVKYAAKTLVKHAKDPLGLKKEEVDLEEKISISYKVPADHELIGAKPGDKIRFDKSPNITRKMQLHRDVTAKAVKSIRAQGGNPANHPDIKINKEEAELEEGWDDMVKAAQEKVKSGPKPNGDAGKKQGSAYGGSKQKDKPEQDVKEATDTVEKDPKTGKIKSWMHTGDWKKSTNKDAHGKVTHASDVARRKTEKMSEAKDPNMDAGVGSQPNFVTDSAKPMQHAQSLAKKSLAKMRSDMMAKKSK